MHVIGFLYDLAIAIVVALAAGAALIEFLSLEAPISGIVAFAVGAFVGRVFFALGRSRA